MLGAELQLGRNIRGDNRFYVPGKGRRNHQNQLQLEQLRRAQSDVTASKSTLKEKTVVNNEEAEDRTRSGAILKPVVGLEPVVSPLCNLERFLESIMPSVPAQYSSKECL